jgi:hypothetical protein
LAQRASSQQLAPLNVFQTYEGGIFEGVGGNVNICLEWIVDADAVPFFPFFSEED